MLYAFDEPCHVAPQNDQCGQWLKTEVSEKWCAKNGEGGGAGGIPPKFLFFFESLINHVM